MKVHPLDSFMAKAWLRDGSIIYTGEALLLAMVKNSQGASRSSEDADVIRKLYSDPNL